ncbi:hypothetical protein Csa_022993 [Cucumis sativus]|uniref:Uncharacterized protein n=1 Tax=Cucumis sativus TaxID=3659 RepID=A0A0A0KC31_CUCSA|nr:hypothetical protein Csa_022993 [Cucumis sativus]
MNRAAASRTRTNRDRMKGLSDDALALARRTATCTAAGLRRMEKRKMVAASRT